MNSDYLALDYACPMCGYHQLKSVASQIEENLGLMGRSHDLFRCLGCQVISQVPSPRPELLEKYYGLIEKRAR